MFFVFLFVVTNILVTFAATQLARQGLVGCDIIKEKDVYERNLRLSNLASLKFVKKIRQRERPRWVYYPFCYCTAMA